MKRLLLPFSFLVSILMITSCGIFERRETTPPVTRQQARMPQTAPATDEMEPDRVLRPDTGLPQPRGQESIPETRDEPTRKNINAAVFKPAQVDASDARVNQLSLPDGFKIEKFAENLGEPRILATRETGHVYVTNREDGEVILLEDTNNDGKADRREVVANIEDAHGLAIHENRLYIVAIKELYAANMNNDGTLAEPELLTADLPDGGQHPNRTIGFSPEGQLFITIGSTCNACPEPNELHATIVRADREGSNVQIYAKGLRNTVGFGWHPQTDELWGMDHGIDMLGDNESKEELNRIKEGEHYGWPYIYDDGSYNPYPAPEDMTYREFMERSTFPELMYTSHAAPMQMVFYDGNQFPAEFRGDAFVAFRGSWNRTEPAGYKVSRIVYEEGQPVRFEDFVTGFLVENDTAHFGRLVGMAVHADGSLLLTDDTNGVMYRISHGD